MEKKEKSTQASQEELDDVRNSHEYLRLLRFMDELELHPYEMMDLLLTAHFSVGFDCKFSKTEMKEIIDLCLDTYPENFRK